MRLFLIAKRWYIMIITTTGLVSIFEPPPADKPLTDVLKNHLIQEESAGFTDVKKIGML
jgi:hypothetical protein